MSIFNKKGMLVFPNPKKHKKICQEEKLLVFTECYCPNGHNLVNENVRFDEFDGIYFKIERENEQGYVALSPVYGCHSRISNGITLKENQLYNLCCPQCGISFPAFSECHCGGNILTLFLDKEANYDSFIGVCNRVGCTNSHIQIGEELITSARLESM